jgi:biotin operon repressor
LGGICRSYLCAKLSLHPIAKRTGLSRKAIRKWFSALEDASLPVCQREKKANKLSVFHEVPEQAPR